MFSFKKPTASEHAFRVGDVVGPDFDDDAHVYLYEVNTRTVPQHVLDSRNTCEILAKKYKDEVHDEHGAVQGTAEVGATGSLQLFGPNRFMLSPDRPDNQRHCIALLGPPGVGKSWTINQYALRWQKLFPDGKIIVVSRKSKEDEHSFQFDYQQADPTDDERPLIGLDDARLYQKEHDKKHRTPFLFVYDDVMTFEPKVRKRILESMTDVVCVGRSFSVDVLVATQEINDGVNTKVLHSNCTHHIFYPRAKPEKVEQALVKRLGFRQGAADHLLEQPTRAIVASNCYPPFVMSDVAAWPQALLNKTFKSAK